MKTIWVLTNMEQQASGMKAAREIAMETAGLDEIFRIEQLDDQARWNVAWEERFKESALVLFLWMGTGLSCDFLKKASSFMQECGIRHLFNIMDAGEDELALMIRPQEKETIEQYIGYGGIDNFADFWLWAAKVYCGADCCVKGPRALPWAGIYRPDGDSYLSTAEYLRRYHKAQQPVIGMVFSREDWLWRRLAYADAIFAEMERQECMPLLLFTTTMADENTGAPSLQKNIEEFFYQGGRPVIDTLINNFVFSLTVTGFTDLAALKKLGVPILQAYHLYRDFAWWQGDHIGMTANELSYAIALPELDGIVHAVPVTTQELLPDGTHEKAVLAPRVARLVKKAGKWARLRRKANADKKVAIIFHNFPPTNSNIGSAASLDSIESVRLLLDKLRSIGYRIDDLPPDRQAFIQALTSHATNDRRFLSDKQIEAADGKLDGEAYRRFFASLPDVVQEQLTRDWGEAPGDVFCYDGTLLIPGMKNGNIYITVQPPRGFGEDPGKIYHSPDCAPTHHYLAFYHWIRDVWQADAMIHVGTHGSLEWLPGKGVAMSEACYPDIATGDIPNIYHYWITCVGEGIQAKRRSAACLISYLSAPMTYAGAYEELAELEKLLEEYIHFQCDEAAEGSRAALEALIREKVALCNIDEISEGDDFCAYVGRLHVFITDLKNMQIHDGLHVLGCPPQGDGLIEYVLQLTRLENGRVPSLTKKVAELFGYDYYHLLENSGTLLPVGGKTYGMLLDEINEKCREAVMVLAEHDFGEVEELFALPWLNCLDDQQKAAFRQVADYICTQVVPGLLLTTLECDNTLAALSGRYVEPSASGAPTSGGVDLLPTGRNFYSVDPKTLPTEAAWKIGKSMADSIIEKFIREEGRYPESVGIILWATSNLRNHGQCVAEFLALMGLKPVWQSGSRRVMGLEVIPLVELKRPRVDVTGRISGLFRDSMLASIDWLNEAVAIVSQLDESSEQNYVRKHILEDSDSLVIEGTEPEEAWRQASYRIFGDPPGAHGAGVGNVLEEKNWETVGDLADVYIRWGAHAYGEGSQGKYLPSLFKKRLSGMEITLQNIDHRESSMLAGDDYNNYRGGLVAAVRGVRGKMPRNYVSDSSDRSKLQLRTLDEELKRWFRGEAMNPKYIEGMKRHGYKGAGDLATYVAVSYQWDATSEVMEDWMYEKYAEKYAFDEAMQEWMRQVNPWALHRIAEVLLEANQRGLWQAKAETKAELESLILSLEGDLEELHDE